MYVFNTLSTEPNITTQVSYGSEMKESISEGIEYSKRKNRKEPYKWWKICMIKEKKKLRDILKITLDFSTLVSNFILYYHPL